MQLRRRIVTCAFVLMAGMLPAAAPRGVAFVANKGSRFTKAQSAFPRQKIVVNDADLARIDAAKVDIREHAEQVKFSSFTHDYLNCDGYRELLKLDDKVVPSLIRDLVRLERAHTIYGKGHYAPTPRDDQEWWLRVEAERQQVLNGALPRHICLATLASTTAGKAARRNGSDGFEESYRWVEWWREHKNRYDLRFKNAETFEREIPESGRRPPGLSCTSSRGLLDVRAVSAPLKNVVDNAAAEAGADVVVLDDSGGLANTTIAVDDREMTFDEFLTALVKDHFFIPWWKEGGTYYVGRGKPAPGCWRSGWPSDDLVCEIKMDKTAFRRAERMPLDISLRHLDRGRPSVDVLVGVPAENSAVFEIQVLDGKGAPLPRKRAPRSTPAELTTRTLTRAAVSLAPLVQIDLASLFDVSRPGDYTVSAKYAVPKSAAAGRQVWRGEATSGVVFVKVARSDSP